MAFPLLQRRIVELLNAFQLRRDGRLTARYFGEERSGCERSGLE